MDTGTKRVVKTRNNDAVAAGSVWESRMRSDQVRGGIKVFNNAEEQQEENVVVENISPKLKRTKQGKRKTWKSENSNGFDKNPIRIAKRESGKDENLGREFKDLGVIKKSPGRAKNANSEFCDGNEKSPVRIVKTRSLLQSGSDQSRDEMEKNSVFLRKVKSENVEILEKIEKKSSDEIAKEFGECEEKEITSNLDGLGLDKVKSSPKSDNCDEDCDAVMVEEIEDETEKNDIEIKEMDVPEQKPISTTKMIVSEEKKIYQRNERSVPLSTIVRKQPPVVNNARVITKPSVTKPVPIADEPEEVHKSHSKLQSLVDLVMWTDASKSAFVFGVGTFAILSSSYTRDFNISFISVLSYVGLVYLAAIFILRSIIFPRGDENTDEKDQDHVVGEEEAVWFVKLILPYINELFLNVRALFSGDPATTMKLAVLLFVLARCGSSLTIWKMAKLGFFGVFTVPKICSSYSSQLTEYGTFWIRRFRDAWESCSHKKAVAFGIFTLVWNLSSTIARIWAVFMLYVAFRYYQQKMVREEWAETGGLNQTSWEVKKGQNEGQKKGQIGVGLQRKGHGPSPVQVKKQNKCS